MDTFASVIDYVRKGLDPAIWEKYRLRPFIRDEIEDIIFSMLDDLNLPDNALVGIYIYGSILTNQWNPKTDIDTRILLDKEILENRYPSLTGDDIFDMFENKLHDIHTSGNEHPINMTVVVEGEETELGQSQLGQTEYEPVYDVLNETMINPPTFADEDFDPDEEFDEMKNQLNETISKLDDMVRDTRIDTIDYLTIKDAISGINNPDKLISKLEDKLEEIEDDINVLVKEYEDIKEDRTKALSDKDSPESIHKNPGNVKYKYLERYKYTDLLKKLKKILQNGVEENEVEEIEKTVSAKGYSMKSKLCPKCKTSVTNKSAVCNKCGYMFNSPSGGEYSEWILDGSKRVAQAFAEGVTDQAIQDFTEVMKSMNVPQNKIDQITRSLEETKRDQENQNMNESSPTSSPINTTHNILKPNIQL